MTVTESYQPPKPARGRNPQRRALPADARDGFHDQTQTGASAGRMRAFATMAPIDPLLPSDDRALTPRKNSPRTRLAAALGGWRAARRSAGRLDRRAGHDSPGAGLRQTRGTAAAGRPVCCPAARRGRRAVRFLRPTVHRPGRPHRPARRRQPPAACRRRPRAPDRTRPAACTVVRTHPARTGRPAPGLAAEPAVDACSDGFRGTQRR